jgi:two-component system chemotaxis family response regulator WspR
MGGEVSSTQAGVRTAAHKGISVFLVDEQPIVAERVKHMLAAEADIAFAHCTDPSQAMKRARELKPTVILQDLMMPDIDGFTLLRFYRADPELSATPIVVLSAREDPRDKSRAFELGASDYIVKLPDRIELVARIRAHSRSYLAQFERDQALRELSEALHMLEQRNAELARLSHVDGLTGISNRRAFDEMLAREARRVVREHHPLSLLLLDVDYFKRYNDHHGHVAGDECLKRIATALGECAQRPGDCAARYGGEEFALILPATDATGALHVAENVRARLQALAMPHPARADALDVVTASVGVVTALPERVLTPMAMIEAADSALYAAKQAGRNRVHVLPETAR